MIRSSVALPCLLSLMLASQSAKPQPAAGRPELAGLLDFEAEHVDGVPKNWNGGPAGTFAVDGQIVHGGRWALRIERNDASPSTFTAVSKMIPIDFAGTQLELRGFLRTADISNFAGLWMRQDDDAGMVALENMQARQLKGTTEWTEYSIVLPLNRAAKRLVFGVLASGTGRVWADDLRLLVDGKPIADVPRVELPKTVVDLDKEFDGGSGIALKELTKIQIANLAMLGKVWGFVKYHHPLVTAGKRHWDYELFRILPRVLAAADVPAARSAINQWITGLGPVPPCAPCATLVETRAPPAAAGNLADGRRAWSRARDNSPRRFTAIDRRSHGSSTFRWYPNIGNPSFDHEPGYATLKLPDPGYQLLALYRFWNIVEYWFPYRDVIGPSWDDELTAFIPRIAMANDSDTYKREMIALIARVHDTHANLWSSLDVRPPTGTCQIPITLRFIEDQAVVTGSSNAAADAASGLQPGDVLSAIDGVAVPELVKRWSPYYAASNEPTRLRDIARSMTRGACGPVALAVSRDGKTHDAEGRADGAVAGEFDRRTHARSSGRHVSKAVARCCLSQAVVRQGGAGGLVY